MVSDYSDSGDRLPSGKLTVRNGNHHCSGKSGLSKWAIFHSDISLLEGGQHKYETI